MRDLHAPVEVAHVEEIDRVFDDEDDEDDGEKREVSVRLSVTGGDHRVALK